MKSIFLLPKAQLSNSISNFHQGECMKTNIKTITGFMKVALILLVLVSQFSWAASSASAESGSISGIIYGPDGNPLTGVSVRVEAIRTADGTGAASTYTDPSDGTYSLIGLAFYEDLAVLASSEDPDVDGYAAVYFDNVDSIDWAVPIELKAENPNVIVDFHFVEHDTAVAVEHLTFNTRLDRILNDVIVRQAIAYGTDRQYILDNAFVPSGNVGEVLDVIMHPSAWFAAAEGDPFLNVYDYSPATANSLLDSAEWVDSDGDGIREKDGNVLFLEFATTDAPARVAAAGYFETQMAAIGIDVDVVLYPSGIFFSDDPVVSPLIQGNFDVAEFAWILSDFDYLVGVYNTSDVQNFGGYSNTTMDLYYEYAQNSKQSADTAGFQEYALLWQYEFSYNLPALPMFTRVTPFISGVIYGPDANPVTGVSVLVRAVYTSDGSEAASTYTNPDDGTYQLVGLPLDQELAVVASDEDPDVDGYPGKYHIDASLDWAVRFLLTMDNPGREGVDIYLGSNSVPVEQLTFNTRVGRLLIDNTIRQAVAYGTDRQGILEDAFEPYGTTGDLLNTVIFPGVWYEAPADDPSLTVYDYNPAMSDSLLNSIGWDTYNDDGYREKDGQELVLDFKTTDAAVRVAAADLFKTQMQAIGIRITVYTYPADFFFYDLENSPLITGDFDIAEFAWTMDDSDYLIGVYYTDNFQNFGSYSNGTLDAYYTAAQDAKHVGDQFSFYENAHFWQYTFSADLPALPLFSRVPLPVIAGTILDSLGSPLTGVSVTLTAKNPDESILATVSSNPDDGYYSLFVPENWSGTVTPSLTGYSFDPVSRPYVDVTGAQSAENYTATPFYALTVTKAGTGSGWVGSSPSGINCGTDCSGSYAPGTQVKLTATPSAGSAFTGWSGACGGVSNICYVTMSKAKSVTATFTTNPVGKYYLSTVKVGSGTIVSTPAGISCPTDCSEFFNSGTSVKLVATASAGYVFTGWSGACGGTTNQCFVSMTKNKTVTATFLAVPTGKYYLGVQKIGTGTGNVSSLTPAGINCGTDCYEFYNAGTVVRLRATALPGSTFAGWSGACGGTGDCWVTMSATKYVKATFSNIAFLPSWLKLLAWDPMEIWRSLD
jgi:uncharacterized repeat protein (TIGR02543 family)